MSTNNNHALNGQQKEIRPIWKTNEFSLKKLSAEKLASLAIEGTALQKITALPLPSRGIEKIENLDVLCELRRLDLSENKLKRLTGMQGLSKLSMLNISKNLLDSDVSLEDLRYLTELRTLNIGENEKLEHINTHIVKPLQRLQALIAHQCQFRKASFVRFLPELNTLILSKNRLSKLNTESLANITKLSLGHNMFSEWPQLTYLPHLQELRINNNQLSSIPSSIVQNKKLKVLDVSHNNLSDWGDVSLLSSLKSLTNLCLKGNPLPRPDAEAKAIVLREDISSDSIADEDELLYRRYVLSMFQSNVGEKGLPKIQLIVLDMKRVKMKFSHNHDATSSNSAIVQQNSTTYNAFGKTAAAPVEKLRRKRQISDINANDNKKVKLSKQISEQDTTARQFVRNDISNEDDAHADVQIGRSSTSLADSGVISTKTVTVIPRNAEKSSSKRMKVSDQARMVSSTSNALPGVQTIEKILFGTPILLNAVGQGGTSAW